MKEKDHSISLENDIHGKLAITACTASRSAQSMTLWLKRSKEEDKASSMCQVKIGARLKITVENKN